MSNAIKLTKEGLLALEAELDELKSTKRKEIAEKIKEAKTDEEVHNIIDSIIALNNSRVQNEQN